MLGLRPTRLTQLRDKQRLIEQHDNVVRLENQRFNNDMAMRMMAGETVAVKQMLVKRELETNGIYSAVRGAEDVAEEVMERMSPFDLARGGTRLASGERRRLANQLPYQEPAWSEVRRLQTKKSLVTQLGVPGTATNTEINRAQLVDQLMAMNPMLGRAEALQMANLMLGAQPRQLQ